jgi:putative transposase
VTERRAAILANDRARDCLRSAFRYCRQRFPFQIDALVILPDHIHTIWTLPADDYDYSKRWGVIKKHFTQHWLASGGAEQAITASRLRYRRRGIWQRRFWEHTLKDEQDYQNHFNYLHFNPVKHGWVKKVNDWPYSSFHRMVEHGIYDTNWGSSNTDLTALQCLECSGEL